MPETSLVPDPVLYVDGWPTLGPESLWGEDHIVRVNASIGEQ